MALWHVMMTSKDHCHRIKIAVKSMSLQAMRLSSSRALTSATSACAMLVCMSWEEQVSKKLRHDQFVLNKAEEQYFASFRSSTSVFIKKWHHTHHDMSHHLASSHSDAPDLLQDASLARHWWLRPVQALKPALRPGRKMWDASLADMLGLACLDHADSSRPCRPCQCGPRRQSLTSQLVSSQTPGKHRQTETKLR